jgi:RecA/RadA recombinase
MSASHRKISRLPLPVFQDLITRPPLNDKDAIDEHDPERLKSAICNRLKRFVVRNNGRKNKNSRTAGGGGGGISGISPSSTCSIKTIGQLLRLSKCTLLFALDPILTYEEVSIFLDRVCNQCSPKPNSVLQLLKDTANANADVNMNNVCYYDNTDGSSCSEQNNASQQQDNRQQQQRPSTSTIDPITFGSSMRDLPTCLPSLDRILRGGVRLGTITELVGKSGTGKTQLALQLCIAAAKFNQGAIYIDSEKKLSLPRLREMSERWRSYGLQERRRRQREQSQSNTRGGGGGGGVGTDHHHPGRQFSNKAAAKSFSYNQGSCGNSSYPTPNSQQSFYSNTNYDNDECNNDGDAMGTFKSSELVLGNLTLHTPGSSSELLDVLDALEDEILQRNQTAGQAFPVSTASVVENINTGNKVRGKYPVRLLIVDSIASPMRRDFGTDSAPQRASAIFQCAQKLKRLADQLHLAVVVINQVGSDSRAALGTSWHHCVSTRLMLETATTSSDANKVGLDHSNGNNEFGINNLRQSILSDHHRVTRKIAVVKSNRTGFGETGFEISTMGIVEDSIAGL